MHWPIIGLILKYGGIFGVKRGQADIGAIKTAMKYLKNGELLLIFPEGCLLYTSMHMNRQMGDNHGIEGN